MNTWEEKWREGLEALDAIAVRIERSKHNLAVLEETLDRIENRIPTKKGLLSRLFKENTQ